MIPKRLLALILFAALAVMPPCGLRAQWVPTHAGTVLSFAVEGTNIFAGPGVLLSTDSGASWNGFPHSPEINTFAVNGSEILGSDGNEVFFSTDSGTIWTLASNDVLGFSGIHALAVLGSNLFVGTDDGVFLSTNNGTSWSPSNNGLPPQTVDRNVYVLGLMGTNLFAEVPGSGVFLSTNNGTNWNAVNNGLTGFSTDEVQTFAVIGTNIFAGTQVAGVFLSTDSGSSWRAVNNGLTNSADSNVLALTANGSNLFAGLRRKDGSGYDPRAGIYLSTDSGTSWTWENDGLVNTGTPVSVLGVIGPNLVVSVDDSIYYRPLSEMIGESTVLETPARMQAIQSYPNPFTQTITLSFTLSDRSAAQVTVENLLGEEVTCLFKGELEVGENAFTWDAAGMPPGIYYCRLVAANSESTTKIVLVK